MNSQEKQIPKTYEQIELILSRVDFPNYTFRLTGESSHKFYLQAEFYEKDVITGDMRLQKTRKWLLSPWMTDSEVVQTAFKCVLTSFEHEIREQFTFCKQRIFSPHYDVYELVELCKAGKFDERDDWYADNDNGI